jgi:hypothetical protein
MESVPNTGSRGHWVRPAFSRSIILSILIDWQARTVLDRFADEFHRYLIVDASCVTHEGSRYGLPLVRAPYPNLLHFDLYVTTSQNGPLI